MNPGGFCASQAKQGQEFACVEAGVGPGRDVLSQDRELESAVAGPRILEVSGSSPSAGPAATIERTPQNTLAPGGLIRMVFIRASGIR